MKTSFLLSYLIVQILVLKAQDDSPQNIVDYFLLLPALEYERYEDTSDLYELRSQFMEEHDVVIDLKNAYFQMADKSNGLIRSFAVSYFKKASGDKLIGVSEYSQGGDCDDYFITFCEFGSDWDWTDVTEDVLPPISLSKFGLDGPGMSELASFMEIEKNVNWKYELPRYGTKLKVTPIDIGEGICLEEELQTTERFTDFEERDRILYGLYPKVLNGRKIKTLELSWNWEKGVFGL